MEERIRLLLKTKELSASAFADQIGVQRSSISHILAGRNKPSLDFLQRVLNTFPDINAEWLISGNGEMSKDAETNAFSSVYQKAGMAEKPIQNQLFPDTPKKVIKKQLKRPDNKETEQQVVENNLEKEKEKQHITAKGPEEEHSKEKKAKKIRRIVIFYTDHSFEEYCPE